MEGGGRWEKLGEIRVREGLEGSWLSKTMMKVMLSVMESEDEGWLVIEEVFLLEGWSKKRVLINEVEGGAIGRCSRG